jgi:hypothetical protein
LLKHHHPGRFQTVNIAQSLVEFFGTGNVIL